MNQTTTDLRTKILQVLSDVSAVPVDDIEDEHELAADLGMDSVALMELRGMLDEEFGIELELEHAQRTDDVGKVMAVVSEQLRVH